MKSVVCMDQQHLHHWTLLWKFRIMDLTLEPEFVIRLQGILITLKFEMHYIRKASNFPECLYSWNKDMGYMWNEKQKIQWCLLGFGVKHTQIQLLFFSCELWDVRQWFLIQALALVFVHCNFLYWTILWWCDIYTN